MSEIQKINHAELSNLRASIFRVMVLVGFKRDNIVKEELDVILDYLTRNFKRLKPEQVVEAFEMGIRGELDIDLTTYQNFNALYVSNVITAWKRKSAEIRRFRPVKQVESKIIPALTYDEIKYHTNTVYKQLTETGKIKGEVKWDEIFSYLEKEKEIDLSREEKEIFADLVREEIKDEISNKKYEGKNTFALELFLSSHMFFKLEVRKRAVLKYFKNKSNK